MNVTRFSEAKPYEAANHHGCEARRLQGAEVSPVTSFWLGVSNFAPGGGAEWDATGAEKVYLVLEGEITVETEDETVTLRAKDSVFLAANERRRIINESDTTCVMAVVIAPSA
ncbi:MAG TPA: cupin domain-containing protein [Acidimicrobiales bacterium]|nr:cupin domain-containing protein [Acidimicrobiales bacterium]